MAATSCLAVKQVAPPFIGLTALGWLLVVIGFGIGSTESDTPGLHETSLSYPYWIVSIVGPFTFFAAFIHLFADMMKLPYAPAVSRIAGAIVSALKPPPDGLGMILYIHGAIIRAATEAGVGEQIQQIEPWINLTFAGSLLATLFWTVVIILWHFNDVGKNDE